MKRVFGIVLGLYGCWMGSFLGGQEEPMTPFQKPVENRPFLMEGTLPFPAPEMFSSETAQKLIQQYGVEEVLFIERATFQSSHYYSDFVDGCRFFGTDIGILNLKTGKVRSLLPEKMRRGIVNRMDISFDAKKVVFDWKADAQSGFHLWEINIDGTGLTQLTFPPADEKEQVERYHLRKENQGHWVRQPECYPVPFGVYGHWTDDLHPCYLPDGGIVFVSNRCQHGVLCDGDDTLVTTVLYRLSPDRQTMEKLTNSSVSEATPTMMEDGRILYTRWEYVDKGGSCVKCLWSMKQDGTGSAEVYGNDIAMPPTLTHGRQVPGNPHLFVATAAPHCPQTALGGIVRIDTTKNIRTSEAMENLTPETEILAEGDFRHPLSTVEDPFLRLRGPCFLDPYPLDAQKLLMSALVDEKAFFYRPDGYGLYFYDGPGKYQLLYHAAGTSCWQPMPLRARPVPPRNVSVLDESLAEKNDLGQKWAKCVVTDVYVGLEGVARGEVKYLRINEQVPRPWAARRTWGENYRNRPGLESFDQQHSPVGATHLGLKMQWGIVPVEEDGSACFYVPADRNIFFQVLDKDFQEIQRERTYVNYRPGETRACIGCHETPENTPYAAISKPLKALERAPSMPQGTKTLDFVQDVQPILDKHCVKCHQGVENPEKQQSRLDLRATPTPFFNVAYENLLGFRCSRETSYTVVERPAEKSLVGKVIREIHPKVGNAEYLPAKTLGSTTAPLVHLLRNGHYGVSLTPEEWIRLVTWIDSNCQFYGTYWGAKHLRFQHQKNFRVQATWEETLQTEVPPRLRQ
ncbi:MAG: hypothetical protein Q4E67_05295 [Planctomycetia bacterium]|nr:hypothetical protein [Planctomycetia bacterium]